MAEEILFADSNELVDIAISTCTVGRYSTQSRVIDSLITPSQESTTTPQLASTGSVAVSRERMARIGNDQ